MRLSGIAAVAAGVLLSTPSWAVAFCGSCADCTTILAQPDVTAELTGDLRAGGSGACVTIRGRHARLDGAGHAIVGDGAVGVRVEADEVFVRNVGVRGATRGVEVAGARGVTLYHLTLSVTGTAVSVERSPDLRVVRGSIEGGRVGVSFGADAEGRCAPSPLRSPGAVVEATSVEGAGVGVAACDAVPVLREVRAQHGGVGLRLGEPSGGSGAYDRCVCAPGLPGVRSGTTLLFSSGCGGCQVHEGWLPTLRAQGADIRLRETGAGHEAAEARFDRHMEHCAPAVMDALGIPGCVPNYACPASGAVAKVRADARSIQVEHPLDAPHLVMDFARACAAAGRAATAGGRCVSRAVTGATACGNREADVELTGAGARWTGADNACGRVQGRGAALGCTRPCDDAPAVAPAPPPPTLTHEVTPEPAPPPEAPVVHDAGVTTPTSGVSPAPTPPAQGGGGGVVFLLAGIGAVGALAAWASRSRS
ncbi:MAG: hypothetical protein R3A52_14825 [Polyangiales bacterium]